MEREQITINGMEFRVERLMPNYKGYHTMHYALRAMALAL